MKSDMCDLNKHEAISNVLICSYVLYIGTVVVNMHEIMYPATHAFLLVDGLHARRLGKWARALAPAW